MDNKKQVVFSRDSDTKIVVTINKNLIGVGRDYVVFELTEEQTLQMGKLALDIAMTSEIKELSLKLE